jgi:hypothetical protein
MHSSVGVYSSLRTPREVFHHQPTFIQLTFTPHILFFSARPHHSLEKQPSTPSPYISTPPNFKMKFTSTILLLSVAVLSSARVLHFRQANSQSFTGALGGIAATPVIDSGDAKRPFSVKGDTFVNKGAALQRSCDQQFNGCANAANGGNANFSTQDCQAQKRKLICREQLGRQILIRRQSNAPLHLVLRLHKINPLNRMLTLWRSRRAMAMLEARTMNCVAK